MERSASADVVAATSSPRLGCRDNTTRARVLSRQHRFTHETPEEQRPALRSVDDLTRVPQPAERSGHRAPVHAEQSGQRRVGQVDRQGLPGSRDLAELIGEKPEERRYSGIQALGGDFLYQELLVRAASGTKVERSAHVRGRIDPLEEATVEQREPRTLDDPPSARGRHGREDRFERPRVDRVAGEAQVYDGPLPDGDRANEHPLENQEAELGGRLVGAGERPERPVPPNSTCIDEHRSSARSSSTPSSRSRWPRRSGSSPCSCARTGAGRRCRLSRCGRFHGPLLGTGPLLRGPCPRERRRNAASLRAE